MAGVGSASRVRGIVGAVLGIATAAATIGFAPDAASAAEDPARADYLGLSHYTGEFHAHTSVSDGSELPGDAFHFVHDETDADFFAVTEHDVMYDLRNGDDFIDDWRDAASAEWRYVHEQADAFNASQDELVAVPGIENTWYDGTGHINVFNTDWKATARAQSAGSIDGFANGFGTGDMKYDMYTFFARLKQDPDAIAQFNHPSTTSKGNFFGFNGLDREVDDRIDLIEVKIAGQIPQYQLALDKGWHLAPVFNGDEHQPNWVQSAKPITGIWAADHSLDSLYAAMRARTLYSTQDPDVVLGFGANGRPMGSILPAGTTAVDVDVVLDDPDASSPFTSVQLIGNGGAVVHTFAGVSGGSLHLTRSVPTSDGDFFYVKATQADGSFAISAPIWVGETTRGANYAPEITVTGAVPERAAYGQRIELPAVTAVDDSGLTPTIGYEVYDAAGPVPVVDGGFEIRGYDDHFIVVKATDATGNINAELLRIVVDQDDLDPEAVFRMFGTTATVAEQPGGAGVAVTTDRSIERAYAQVRQVGAQDWDVVGVRSSTGDRDYEVNTIGRDAPAYIDQITGQTLRSHEFDLRGLAPGARYEYRLGASADGAPSPTDDSAWTEVLGEFVAGGGGNEPIYLVGDLQATTHDPSDLGLLRDVVDRLRSETPGGRTLIQTGDLVDNGGRGQYWDEVFDEVFDGLDIQVAPVAGNHETYGDLDYDSLSENRTAIFSNMYDLPKNGMIGESNYSFTRGDVHVAILNSNVALDEQLAWLADDIRASTSAWNVVSGHFSYYGGSHGDDPGMAADRAKVTTALDEIGVDLYVGGHDHVYKRSTVYDGRLAATPEEEAAGTTFVTLGSAGPKFYDNVAHWWDDVVFDEDTQMGSVMQLVDDGLRVTTYTLDGRVVDDYTVRKPSGTWRMGSVGFADGELQGVGFLSYPGSRSTLTVTAAAYDASQQQLLGLRTAEVTLRQSGGEQFVAFDTPLAVAPGDTVKVYVWDSLGSGAPLVEAVLVREGIAGHGTAEDPYLVRTAADLLKIDYDPSGYYRLANDLDLGGVVRPQIGEARRFTGVFDGGGHTISGFAASPEIGAGLFLDNYGTIRDLHVDAQIDTTRSSVAILADVNHGTIERSWVSGSIVGQEGVAGLAGYSYGIVRDSYSTADVTARGFYAGGAVGIARGGSTTSRVYATGAVVAVGRNAGGVVSYGNDETVVDHSVALNTQVTAPSFAHAIVGRVADGQVAVLEENYVSAAVPVGTQSVTTAPTADSVKGAIVPTATTRSRSFYEGLGWDFATTWQWSDDGRRPVLRGPVEVVPPRDPSELPQLTRADDGRYLVETAADLAELSAHPAEDYRLAADIDLGGTSPRLGAPTPFSGELDGAGHSITGLDSTTGGLFATMNGWVHDLGVVGARVSKTGERTGILADQSAGTVERVYTTGAVVGGQRTGGIVGDSFGIIRDSYSTATVSGSGNRYSGGVVGITEAGSLTERVYASGAVSSTSDRSVAGISGYAYAGTTIRDSIALNPSVTGSSFAHRVVSRVGGDVVSVATLVNNAAVETLLASVQSDTAVGGATLNGATWSAAQAGSSAGYADALGWDFADVWQWSAEGGRPVLRGATELIVPPPTGPALARDTDGAYLVARPGDLLELSAWPGETFRLASDLDLTGAQLAGIGPFTGELDGAGHRLTGFTSTAGGLFASIEAGARVHDLGVVGAAVSKAGGNVGVLADTNRGTIERVFTSGSVTGTTTVGGIVGTNWAVIRDSYSTANASTTTSNYAGGIIGIAESGSTTERVYAGGEVRGGTTAGGITGYARNSTTVIRDSFAIGSTVTATGFGHRIAARAASGQTATLVNNSAVETLVAAVQSTTATGPTTLNGQTRAVAETRAQATWESGLGWDFGAVWRWSTELERPVLRSAAE